MKNKKMIFLLVLVLVFLTSASYDNEKDVDPRYYYDKYQVIYPYDVCKNGIVPDEETAISIAKIYFKKAFGEKRVDFNDPYNVELIDNIWYVRQEHKPMPKGVLTIVLELQISKITGKVMLIQRER